VLREIEHDLIHNLYFKVDGRCRTSWSSSSGRLSERAEARSTAASSFASTWQFGHEHDLEERLIGNGNGSARCDGSR